MRETVILRDRQCVFPGCGIDARGCDLDHIDALCATRRRRPARPNHPAQPRLPLPPATHRLKTFTAWTYQRLPDGDYQWTNPHGQHLHGHPRPLTHALAGRAALHWLSFVETTCTDALIPAGRGGGALAEHVSRPLKRWLSLSKPRHDVRSGLETPRAGRSAPRPAGDLVRPVTHRRHQAQWSREPRARARLLDHPGTWLSLSKPRRHVRSGLETPRAARSAPRPPGDLVSTSSPVTRQWSRDASRCALSSSLVVTRRLALRARLLDHPGRLGSDHPVSAPYDRGMTWSSPCSSWS